MMPKRGKIYTEFHEQGKLLQDVSSAHHIPIIYDIMVIYDIMCSYGTLPFCPCW